MRRNVFSREVGQKPLVVGLRNQWDGRVETSESVRCVLSVSWQRRDRESWREAEGSLEFEGDCFKIGTPA